MNDVTIIGSGATAHLSAEVLTKAGYRVHNAAELEEDNGAPVILGETLNAFSIARQAVQAGRDLLIASPAFIPSARLALLFSERKRAQALFVWNERRYHPGYRFVANLTEADATWRPRYLRLETLTTEAASASLARWRILESLALLLSLTPDEAPLNVSGLAEANPVRSRPDLVTFRLAYRGLEAFVQVGMGEAIERRETLLASSSRKVYVDELNACMPVRLLEDESHVPAASQARWLSCPATTAEEMARQQCFAFLEATGKTSLARAEARLWRSSLDVLDALDHSLEADGALASVGVTAQEPRFRLILGGAFAGTPQTAA